jgi:hypothetical protein
VVDKRNSSLLQAHPQDQIIGSLSQGVITRSHKHASFIEHHPFVSCVEPTCIDKVLQDPDWVNAMHEELHNFTHNQVWTHYMHEELNNFIHKMQGSLEQNGCLETNKMTKV